MKLTAKYNLKDIWNKAKSKIDKYGKFVMVGIALSTVVACEKPDPAPEPTPSTPTDTTTPVTPVVQKHNVELVYGKLPSSQWQNISLDTIRKYNADETVDTIFMIPEVYNQYSTFNTTQVQTIVNKLRDRYNVNTAKVRGKGELQLNNASVENNPEITRFFRDTLGYDVTMHYTKSR